MKRLFATIAAIAALAGCHRAGPDRGRIEGSVIGARFAAEDADRAPLTAPGRARLSAIAQGLVRFDEAGQIVPGLAQRWIVSDDGRSFIFRLDRQADPAGGAVDAQAVARRLRRAVAGSSRNPLKPVLGAIESVNAITNEVVEIRLSAPRPNLLQLVAQAELAVPVGDGGGGPLTRIDGNRTTLLLADDPGKPDARQVLVHAEPAARAVARFAGGGSRFVLGGTIADYPLVRAADLRRDRVVVDAAEGLFGLAFLNHDGILGDPARRAALAAAIDRARLAGLFGSPDWPARSALVPDGLADMPAPRAARAGDPALRLAEGDAVPILRVALPAGPAGTLLAAALAVDWRGLGIGVVRVGPGDPADLALVDEIAPADTAAWYLRHFTCDRSAICDPTADAVLIAARRAPTLADRARLLAQADALLEQAVVFVPIARPLRWSLVAAGQAGIGANPRAVHPLDALIADPSKR